MTTNYEQFTAELSGNEFIKKINEDGSISFIPKDLANADYQAYLADEAKTK